MSEPAEIELLELPAEFRGRPYSARYDAQQWAEAAVQVAFGKSGTAAGEHLIVQAAAHYLAITGDGSGAPPVPRASGDKTVWCGSPYGDAIAAQLANLPRASGRGRQFPFAVS